MKILILVLISVLLLAVPLIVSSLSTATCLNENTLHISSSENVSINGVLTEIDHEEDLYCENGCYDNITPFGSACSLPEIYIVSVGFGLIILFIFMIYTLPKVLKKKRGR